MAIDLRPSDREDPFRDLPRLSLFPQTLAALPHAAAVSTALETQTLEPIDDLFKSMALKGSTKLLEQAQIVSTSSTSIQDLYFEAEDKAVLTNGNDSKNHHQGRRPALGRKRGQFNFKPKPSDSSAGSSIYDIVEPQEYFLALDRMQKAEKELKKHTSGVATDLAQHHESKTVRNRRPGLLGRTASYKHHRSADADVTEAFKELPEVIPDRKVPSPAKVSTDIDSSNILHIETGEGISDAMRVNKKLGDMEGEGSISDKEKIVDGLLENLFSSVKGLDGDYGLGTLQDRLQNKSANVGKMTLPGLDGTERTNLRMLNTTTGERSDVSQLPETISTAARKSLLSVVANLQRQISLKERLSDTYAMPPSDDTPYSGGSIGHKIQPNSSSVNINHGVANRITTDGTSTSAAVTQERSSFDEKIHLPFHEANITLDSNIISEEDNVHASCVLDNSVDPSSFSNDENDVPTGHDGCSEKEANNIQINTSTRAQSNTLVKVTTLDLMKQNDTEVLTSPSSRNMDGNSRISGVDVSAASFGCETTLPGEVNVILEEPVSDSEASKENASTSRAFLSGDGHLENMSILPEENNEIHGYREDSGPTSKRVQKRKAHPNGQNKKKHTIERQSIARRKSLADAGLIWKSGVRRSTRIKSRPLEYWRGERFLYGRIHASLSTVIGLKYASLEDKGKSPVLKVKSFVPEEHACLLSKVAL